MRTFHCEFCRGRRFPRRTRRPPGFGPSRALLAAVDHVTVRQDVQVARAARAVLHPVLEVRLWAHTLRSVVLELAPLVVFAKLSGATRENLEAQPTMGVLVGDIHEPRIVHMRMRCSHGVIRDR